MEVAAAYSPTTHLPHVEDAPGQHVAVGRTLAHLAPHVLGLKGGIGDGMAARVLAVVVPLLPQPLALLPSLVQLLPVQIIELFPLGG